MPEIVLHRLTFAAPRAPDGKAVCVECRQAVDILQYIGESCPERARRFEEDARRAAESLDG